MKDRKIILTELVIDEDVSHKVHSDAPHASRTGPKHAIHRNAPRTSRTGPKHAIHADLRTCSPSEPLPLVIVCHGFLGYKRWGFFPYVSECLAAAGFHVLTMSFSLNGADERTGEITALEDFAHNTVSREIEDLRRTCSFVRSASFPLQVGENGWCLMGHSRGGAIAIMVAPEFEEIRSLATWSAMSRFDRYTRRRKEIWRRDGALVFEDKRSPVPLRLDYSYYEDIDANRDHYDLPRRAHSLDIPHLLVHGERDAAVSLLEARELLGSPLRENARLEVIKGCGHTFGITHPMLRANSKLERAITITEDWFKDTNKPPGKEEC